LTQVVNHLSRKHEALSSKIPVSPKKKKDMSSGTPAIPATWEVKTEGLSLRPTGGKSVRCYLKNKARTKGPGICLKWYSISRHALDLSPSTGSLAL
jgi:hypothetical protein